MRLCGTFLRKFKEGESSEFQGAMNLVLNVLDTKKAPILAYFSQIVRLLIIMLFLLKKNKILDTDELYSLFYDQISKIFKKSVK